LKYELTPGLGLHNYGISLSHSYSIVFLVAGTHLFHRIHRNKVPISKIESFTTFLFSSLQEKKFLVLSASLEKYLDYLIKVGKGKLLLWLPFIKLRDYIRTFDYYYIEDIRFDKDQEREKPQIGIIKKSLYSIVNFGYIRNIYNWTDNYIDSRSTLVINLFTSIIQNTEFVKHLAQTKPYMCLRFDKIDNFYSNDFFKQIIAQHYSDSFSALQNEIRNNLSGYPNNNRYTFKIFRHNRILKFLFDSDKRFEKLQLDNFILLLILKDLQSSSHQKSKYNKPHKSFDDFKSYDRIYLYLTLYDILLREAIDTNFEESTSTKNLKWHYEVPILHDIIVEMAKNNSVPNNGNSIFTTIYERFIYEILEKLKEWLAIGIKPESVKLYISNNDLKNNTEWRLAAYLVECYIKSICFLWTSNNINKHFKDYLVIDLANTYQDLKDNQSPNHNKFYLKSLKETLGSATKLDFIKAIDRLEKLPENLKESPPLLLLKADLLT